MKRNGHNIVPSSRSGNYTQNTPLSEPIRTSTYALSDAIAIQREPESHVDSVPGRESSRPFGISNFEVANMVQSAVDEAVARITLGNVIGSGLVQSGNQISLAPTQKFDNLTVTNTAIVTSRPTEPLHVANKSYVDGLLEVGTGLVKSGNTLSVSNSLTNVSSVGVLNGLTVSGNATLQSPPTEGNHATTKNYVDSIYVAGLGLSKNDTTFSVDETQSQITTVGTLKNLTVDGNITINSEPTSDDHVVKKSYVDSKTKTVMTNVTQYEKPKDGDTVTVKDDTSTLILHPASSLSSLTIDMPDATNGHKFTIVSSQGIENLTMNGTFAENNEPPGSFTAPMEWIYSTDVPGWFLSA